MSQPSDPAAGADEFAYSYDYVDSIAFAPPSPKTTFADGRPSSIGYADGEQVTFVYDDAGRIAVATVGDSRVSRAYDAEGRMVEERIGDQVVTACYAFDGQLESLGTTAGEVRFAYDGDRRLTRVQDWSGASQLFSYDGADQSQLRDLPGLREERTLTCCRPV